MILKASAAKGALSSAGRSARSARPRPCRRERRRWTRGDLERRGQQLDDRVEQWLHALVLEGGAAEHRRDLGVEAGAVQARWRSALVRDLLFAADTLPSARRRSRRQASIRLRPVFLGWSWRSAGISIVSYSAPSSSVQTIAFISTTSTTPLKSPSLADRAAGSAAGWRRAGPSSSRTAWKKSAAGAIHLVDVGEARHGVLVGLAPDGLRLRLDAGDRVEDGDGAVQHAQAALDLDREVDVAGRVDDVDPVALPLAGGGGGG